MIKDATFVLILTAWLAAAVFFVRFALTNWYRRTAGRLTMAFIVAIFALMTLVVVTQFFGREFPGRDVVRFVIYGGINILLWRGVWVMFRDQRKGHL